VYIYYVNNITDEELWRQRLLRIDSVGSSRNQLQFTGLGHPRYLRY
jgi:hypothetical protein